MATVIENLFVAIRADSKGLDKDLKGVLGKFKKLENVGKNLSFKLSLPIVALSGVILKMAGDFESAMNTVAAKSGATGVEFQKLENLAKKLGATTRFSATQAAQGMAFLAQAGFDANQILAALPATLDLAAAGGLDLARAADIASNVLKGFRLEAEEAGRAADVLALAAAKTNTDVEELGAAMSRIAPVAADLGVSMEETAAAIGALSDAGIKGFRAGTALRAIMAKLAGPTGQAAKAMKKLGISTRDLQGNFVGLPALMEQFARAERNAADQGQFFADKVKIFGTEMVSSAGILINKGGPALRALTLEFQNSGGAAKRMAEIMERGLAGSLRLLKSAFESLAISIGGSGLLDFTAKLARNVADMIRSLAAFSSSSLRFIVLIGAMTAAIGPLLAAIGFLGPATAAAFAFIGGPITLIIAAIGVLTAAFLLSRDGASDWLSTVSSAAKGLGVAFDAVKGVFTETTKATREFGGELKQQADETVPQYIKRLREARAALNELEEEEKDVSVAALVMGLALEAATPLSGVTQFLAKLGNVRKQLESLEIAAAKSQLQVNKMAVEMRTAATASEIMEDRLLSNTDQIDIWLGFVDKAGGAIQTFGKKVAEQVQKMRDSAASAKISAAAWDIWADVQDKADAASGRFNLALSKMEVPLGIVTGKMMGLSAQVRQAIEDFKASGPPLLTMADNLQTVASQGDKVRIALSKIPPELAKLTPGQELLRGIMEALKAGKEQAGSFAEAMRLLAFDAAFAKLALEDQARVVDELREQWREYTGEAEKTREEQEKLNAAINDVSGILADAVLGFVSLGEAMKNFAINIVGDILQSAFKALLTDMLTQDKALQKLISSWKSFLGLFGGGKKVAGDAGEGVGDVITGGGGGGGGTLGIIDTVTGIVSAISSIVSNFQLEKIHKALNFIELNTRQTARALIGDSAARVRGVLTTPSSAATVSTQPTGETGRKGFAVPSLVDLLVPPVGIGKALFGGGGEEQAAPFAGAGIGITGQLFALQDFASDQLAQLEFQTDSLDTLKDQAGRREGLLETIRDSLSGIGSVGFGGAVVSALLGEINEALRSGSDLIAEVRNTVAAVRQQFVFARDIAEVTRDQQLRVQEEILKELKMIAAKPAPVASISEFTQAAFRSQLNLGEAIP